MEKNSMYFNVHQTQINRSVYRPSSNLSRFVKFLWCIVLQGHSPIENRPRYMRHIR
jgi:hypothetical protein